MRERERESEGRRLGKEDNTAAPPPKPAVAVVGFIGAGRREGVLGRNVSRGREGVRMRKGRVGGQDGGVE